jgi:6-phosphogluconolactonase
MALAVTEFAARETLMQATAERIASTLQDALGKHGSACAALSGGSTPAPAYRALATQPLAWPKITFALVDERFVPPTDPASNERLLRETLRPAFDAGAALKAMFAPASDVEQAADIADPLYAALRIDIALMGMGPDGHTASWFPGAEKLAAALDLDAPRTVIGLNAPQAEGSPDRLTLTRAALARAGRVVLLITGTEKREHLEAALAGDWAPVAALFAPALPQPEVLWAP